MGEGQGISGERQGNSQNITEFSGSAPIHEVEFSRENMDISKAIIRKKETLCTRSKLWYTRSLSCIWVDFSKTGIRALLAGPQDAAVFPITEVSPGKERYSSQGKNVQREG